LRDEKDLSHRHITNIVSTLTTALNFAVEMKLIKDNPNTSVKIPRVEKAPKERIVIEPENIEVILSRFPEGNKWHLPLMIGFHTGMRISEVFGLTWDDIDLDYGYINVGKQTIRYKEDNKKARWCFGKTKTKAGVRSLKMGATLWELLKRENVRQKQNRLLYGEYYVKYGLYEFTDKNNEKLYEMIPSKTEDIKLVCVDHDGSMITTDSFKYCSRVIHHELKLKFDFHSLRHTHATILSENGVNPKNLQTRMGHEKIETTLRTYIHNTEKMDDQSAELFERALARTK
jgi:integrase